MDSLSCSEPDTDVLELLPSLPERSHMTLGTSVLASANSSYGQQDWAQALGALCGHDLAPLFGHPRGRSAGPLLSTSAVARGSGVPGNATVLGSNAGHLRVCG